MMTKHITHKAEFDFCASLQNLITYVLGCWRKGELIDPEIKVNSDYGCDA